MTILVRLFALLTILIVSACSGLQFRDDRSFEITAPRNDATVRIPFTVSYRVKANAERPPRFGVFIDRYPPRPGDEVEIKPSTRGVYITDALEVRVDEIARVNTVAEADRDRHEITVVFLDESNLRLTETSAFVRVRVRR